MKGRTCLITGATNGIGQEAALALARAGAHVVVVARDPRRGDDTVTLIRERSGNPAVELMIADLSSQTAIRQLAKDFEARYPHLHVLINNAGAVQMERRTTRDGL